MVGLPDHQWSGNLVVSDRLEVIVPTQAMTELAIPGRTAEGFEEVARLPLD